MKNKDKKMIKEAPEMTEFLCRDIKNGGAPE